jgi:antirestriction protein ArdC
MSKWKPKKDYEPVDHYKVVTDKIIEALEQGRVPWRRPWDPEKAGGRGQFTPQNPVSGTRYRGINAFLLGMDARAISMADPRWMTFNQAKEKGWNVRKGEKGTTVFFYKKLQVEDETAEEGKKTIPILKAFTVFHASQVDGIPPYVAPKVDENAPWTRPEAADVILKNSGAIVKLGGDRAFYSPSTDHIQLPPDSAFNSPHEWAATALHELGHWTGHKDRLNRDLTGRFGSGAYAQEELRAELASAFIAAETGLPTEIPQHASYIGSWLKALRDDKREIFRAASDAQKISDMCLGFHPEWKAARDAEKAMEPDAPEEAPAIKEAVKVEAPAPKVEAPAPKDEAPGAPRPSWLAPRRVPEAPPSGFRPDEEMAPVEEPGPSMRR